MTLLVNKLTFDVFQHESEDKNKIFSGLRHFFPPELQDSLEKIFKEDIIIGFHKNKVTKLYLELFKNNNTQTIFLFMIKQVLKSVSYYDLLERISEYGELFIRLSKQNLITGKITIDNSSDVVKVVIKFLYFNKKIDKTKEIYEFLKSLPLE